MKNKVEYYIVDKRILPNSIKSVIKANELIQKSKMSKSDAIKKVGISRSTYYKYKDYIKSFYESVENNIYSIHLTITDRSGMLSAVLDTIAAEGVNILTVVQNMPVDGIAKTTIMIQTNSSILNKFENIVSRINEIDGVKDIRIIGSK